MGVNKDKLQDLGQFTLKNQRKEMIIYSMGMIVKIE